MATSSEWSHLYDPTALVEQEKRHDSFPEQPTPSSQILPEPDPNKELELAVMGLLLAPE